MCNLKVSNILMSYTINTLLGNARTVIKQIKTNKIYEEFSLNLTLICLGFFDSLPSIDPEPVKP